MASARQRGKRWSARWRLQDGRGAEKGGFLDRKSALNFAKEQEVLERKNINTRPSEVNMSLFDFVDSVWRPTLKVGKSTRADYQRSLNTHILPVFGEYPLSKIKPADIESWIVALEENTLPEPLAPRTAEKHVNLLASIFNKAQANGYIQKTPFATIKRKKAKILHKRIPLTNQEVKALAQALPPQYRILVWIGYWTGMRPSEILGLSWSQLDFEKGTINVDRQVSADTQEIWSSDGLKTDSSNRVIGFSKELQRLIKEHVELHGFGPEGLILKNRLGGVLRYKDAARLFRLAAKAIGLQEGQRMHVLRHTCVSVLIAQGVNIKAIQAWVGHSTISQTLDTYGHLFPGSMAELAAKLDEYALLAASDEFLRMAN